MGFLYSLPDVNVTSFAGQRLTCACGRQPTPTIRASATLNRPLLCLPLQPRMVAPGIKIGRPKTNIKKDTRKLNESAQQAEPETGGDAAKARPKRKTQADEIPMYKVILLGDEEYEEGHVVTQLQKVIPKMRKEEAQEKYYEAQNTGSSIVCVVAQEHAEFYAQQLKRQDIFVTVEKDE